jgi:hypothetical protein
MRTVTAMLVILLCMTGCTWREAVTTTSGMVAAGLADVDPVGVGTLAESAVDLGFEATNRPTITDAEKQRRRDGEIAERLVNGN